jgi:GT2 family glycosyltransferase
MKLAVVIPVRNRPALIEQCVRGVLACNWPAEQLELIVVDNASTDDTAARAAAAGARVISEPRPNRCLARNRGARAATAEWIAFIDSDCLPDPGWLAELAAAIQASTDPHLAAVAGTVVGAPPANHVERYFEHRRWFDQAKYLNPPPGEPFSQPFAITANLCVKRATYLSLGGLDATLPHSGEDADWCWRLAAGGGTLAFAPAARVQHFHRATALGLYRQAWHWGRGQADLFAKWQPAWHATHWIDPRYYIWALKGLLKAPVAFARERDPFLRRLPWYDFLANAGLALGRLTGGLIRRKWVA